MATHNFEATGQSGEWVEFSCQNDGCEVKRIMWKGQQPHDDERCAAASEREAVDRGQQT